MTEASKVDLAAFLAHPEIIKILLTPRKNNLDYFYTLTPKQYTAQFPPYTKNYRDRGRT